MEDTQTKNDADDENEEDEDSVRGVEICTALELWRFNVHNTGE